MRCLGAFLSVRARLRRFRLDGDGATAIEFALVAAPFLALVFAIIETALVFFAGQVLETGVTKGARLIRTGQVQAQGNFDAADFKEQVCANIAGLLDCAAGLKIDVRTYASFDQVDVSRPIDENGELVEDFGYEPGGGGDIVVVRAFYEWPTFVPGFGINIGDLANGNRLLASASTFRNEPF